VSLDFWANVGFDNPAPWSINRGEFFMVSCRENPYIDDFLWKVTVILW
jgi:hypothetical protein